jgi:predicted aldo/keto reductase-like oxidoreductase
MGGSERVVGKALQDGYREKVKLATKLSPMSLKSADEFAHYFNSQLERLQTDKIDYYLLHGMNKKSWQQMKDWKAIQFVEKKIAEGKVGYLGFSFHDDYEVFKEIIDGYDNWTFCQIQYNFMDVDFQAGTRGLKYAADKGLAVVVMEPLRGGKLTGQLPEAVARVWTSTPQKRTPAEWGLLWVWNHPEVSVVLSGMSNMEQVVENIKTAEQSGPNTLTADELALIDRVREVYKSLIPVPCTSCEYCMPCPNGVAIPQIFSLYNDAIMYNNPDRSRMFYQGRFGFKKEQQADNCIECGECIEACPQEIPITDWLKKAHELLGPESKSK